MAKTETHITGAALQPPSNFSIELEVVGGKTIRWRGPVIVTDAQGRQHRVECETGYPIREDSEDRQVALRKEVWGLIWAGEQGRTDLLAYARVDRHDKHKRVVSPPGISFKTAE